MPHIAAAALRRGPLLGLGLAAALSFASLAAIPPGGFHPLAQLACLLPPATGRPVCGVQQA